MTHSHRQSKCSPIRAGLCASLLYTVSLVFTAGCARSGQNERITPRVQAPARPAPVFEDIAAGSGINFVIKQTSTPINIQQNIGHGVALIDVFGHGLLDIVLVGPNRVSLFKNLGSYRFQDVTAQSGLTQNGFWEGVAAGDYDNDGREDLYLCGYNCSALYHNEGEGRFRETTREAGLTCLPVGKDTAGDWRTSAGFVDLDGKGRLDLYVCRYCRFGQGFQQLCKDPQLPESMACSPIAYTPQKGILYRNCGGGRFQDVTVQSGMDKAHGRSLGVAFGDYDNDGKIDIALANDEIQGDLFRNSGNLRFENHGIDSNTALGESGQSHGGMGVDWADYRGDGRLSLFVATFQNEEKDLYRNLGGGVFQVVSQEAGLAGPLNRLVSFGAKFLDYDNDGHPDLIIANGHVIDNTARLYPGTQYRQPVMLYHNMGDRFEDATPLLGPAASRLMAGRGLAAGDLSNSGRLDVVVSDLDGPAMLLKNLAVNTNNWITLRLQGVTNCRDGFGARVLIHAGGKTQFCDVTNAGSFMAANDPRVHFGLGNVPVVDTIVVRWANGRKDVYHHIQARRFYRLVEGSAAPQREM